MAYEDFVTVLTPKAKVLTHRLFKDVERRDKENNIKKIYRYIKVAIPKKPADEQEKRRLVHFLKTIQNTRTAFYGTGLCADLFIDGDDPDKNYLIKNEESFEKIRDKVRGHKFFTVETKNYLGKGDDDKVSVYLNDGARTKTPAKPGDIGEDATVMLELALYKPRSKEFGSFIGKILNGVLICDKGKPIEGGQARIPNSFMDIEPSISATEQYDDIFNDDISF
jgi:hypothetical protein